MPAVADEAETIVIAPALLLLPLPVTMILPRLEEASRKEIEPVVAVRVTDPPVAALDRTLLLPLPEAKEILVWAVMLRMPPVPLVVPEEMSIALRVEAGVPKVMVELVDLRVTVPP